jgi:tetratricopeptide (TPR) repeat protein
MKRARFGLLLLFPIGLLSACAGMPIVATVEPASVTPALVPPVPPAPPPPAAPAQFIADQRMEARRLDASGMPNQARQHWRYVLALLPRDDEATGEIARLDALIKTRRDAALARGEMAMMRGRAAEAQTAFLKALALDGGNEQARRRLIELENRAAFARQDRKDTRTRATRASGTEGPEN